MVLGCTHFVYLAEALEIASGSAVRDGCAVIDSRDGVARQTKRIAARLRAGAEAAASSMSDTRSPSEALLYITGTALPDRYVELAARFAVRPVGVL